MFGEDILFGQKDIKVDSKGRIFIPSETKRETGDNLVLLYDKDLDVYRIYNFKTIKDILNDLNDKILNSKTKLEVIEYKKKSLEISRSIIRSCKVDTQGRITIGNLFENQDTLLVIGNYDNLVIEPKCKK